MGSREEFKNRLINNYKEACAKYEKYDTMCMNIKYVFADDKKLIAEMFEIVFHEPIDNYLG